MGRYPRAGWLGAGRTLEPGGERHRTGQQRRARAGRHLVSLAGRDFRAIKGWPLMADLLPAFPAGLWLMAASMLVRITRFARAFSLISPASRSKEHTSELQSLMRISYAVFCLKKKNKKTH